MPEFMVVLRGSDPELKRVAQEDVSQIMERYYAWVDRLKQEKRYLGGSPFREGSKLLSGHRELVVIQDGPFSNGDALTGYFVVAAKDFGEAVDVAKSCPALSHGETVEVIELDN